MDINNILNKIENYKNATAERAEQERIAAEHHRQSLLDQIQVMKPDIDNLVKVAKAAQEAGIPLRSGYMIDHTYENGDFFTDAMTHKVGFVPTSFINKAIIGIGFEGGGCCGQYDFFTNGSVICDKNRDNGHDREASTEHLEKFIEKFPEFEKAFYDYIEKKTNREPVIKTLYIIIIHKKRAQKNIKHYFYSIKEAEDWWENCDYFENNNYTATLWGFETENEIRIAEDDPETLQGSIIFARNL